MSEERACGLRDVVVLRADAREPYSRDVSMLNEARRGEHVEYTVIHSQSALPSDALMPSCVLWKRPQEAACSSDHRHQHSHHIRLFPFLGVHVACGLLKIKLT